MALALGPAEVSIASAFQAQRRFGFAAAAFFFGVFFERRPSRWGKEKQSACQVALGEKTIFPSPVTYLLR